MPPLSYEVYSRCLYDDQLGCPLSAPQPNAELCDSYRWEGLKIGDVGSVTPDGSFDVLFNITLPPDEQPYPRLVPENFMPIPLNQSRDLHTQLDAVPAAAGEGVLARGSVQLIRERVDSIQRLSGAKYEFSLSSGEGAVLILPEGAESCNLKNEKAFLEEAIRQGVYWYKYATEKAGRLINNDSLYLVTGFHKARSWSLGATNQGGSGLRRRHLKFEIGQIDEGTVTAQAYRWTFAQGFVGRVGPTIPYDIPNPIVNEGYRGVNQTVFIRGFRITVNKVFFIIDTVSVETPKGITSGGLWTHFRNLIWGRPPGSSSSGAQGTTDNTVDQDYSMSHSRLYKDTRMAIDRIPDASQAFHPGDLVNRYMLKKEPRAKVAITHDSLWIDMLQMRLLELADFSRENRLEEVLSKNYQIIVEDGAVYLQERQNCIPYNPRSSVTWTEALRDANEMIALDPSSPRGYEIKHAALHKGGDYDNAIDALEMMHAKFAESRDPDCQQHADQYIHPSTTRAAIRRIVQRTVRHLPHVLINTATGRLCNRAEQQAAFESLPVFKELVSSMTKCVDDVRIKHEVQDYFRYVMLSHTWEDNEPLFQRVLFITVYDLEQSPTHDKLQMFCKIVRDAGFNWAWSDTCCIDKSDHFVLQEALVAMFMWYQGAAMMIVFLRGVRPSSPLGALAKSPWNTRAWTLQEYIAARVVRFYTEDWTLYQDLELPNHKESPEIISEMEQATGVSAGQLMALRPGLSHIREKLRLASSRKTSRVEDAAYSLFGIFSAIGISAIYGEGEASLGRLLANVITRSGDVSTLAWTGKSSPFNSCLPAGITVYTGPATSHLPAPIPHSEMERAISRLGISSFDLDVALRLYDRLKGLHTPRFAESRMTLPCIAFRLPSFSADRTSLRGVYCTNTTAFGTVKVRTRIDLSRVRGLYLVHPWLDTLLEHDIRGGAGVEDNVMPQLSWDSDDEGHSDEVDKPLAELPPPPTPVEIEPMDRETGARRLAVRLRQPFGALLLQQVQTGRRANEYRRIAADCLIMVQIRENVSLADILDNICILDVL